MQPLDRSLTLLSSSLSVSRALHPLPRTPPTSRTLLGRPGPRENPHGTSHFGNSSSPGRRDSAAQRRTVVAAHPGKPRPREQRAHVRISVTKPTATESPSSFRTRITPTRIVGTCRRPNSEGSLTKSIRHGDHMMEIKSGTRLAMLLSPCSEHARCTAPTAALEATTTRAPTARNTARTGPCRPPQRTSGNLTSAVRSCAFAASNLHQHP